ncbi:DJ-1/PfpI family protein [Pedobacter sp.]|uniref:DJ-1/PfpI family protein n=1 Tax=Pedobacter sp. TaxID=1411316 RepID=UPI003C3F0592
MMKSIQFFKRPANAFLHLSLAILLCCTISCKDKKQASGHKANTGTGKIKVAILVYPGMELLDFSGPAEVFSNARGFEVFSVSSVKGTVSTVNGAVSINPDYTLNNAPLADILVVPGGPIEITGKLGDEPAVMDYIRSTNARTKLTMSVCTGAEILAKAGILDGKKATTHSGALDTLQKLFPKTQFIPDVRFVEDGKVITTAGVSAGIDGALHVVEKLAGLKEAYFVTSVMEYDKWKPEDGFVVRMKTEPRQMQKMEMSPVKKSEPGTVSSGEVQKDIICGMDVSGNAYTSNFKGKSYHFCSASCKKLFDQHPDLYAVK